MAVTPENAIQTLESMVEFKANISAKVIQLEGMIAQLSAQDNTRQLAMAAVQQRCSSLESQMVTVAQERGGGNRKRALLNDKEGTPEKFGYDKGPLWRIWSKEVQDHVEGYDIKLGQALKDVLFHPTAVEPQHFAQLQIMEADDLEFRRFLVNRCCKGTPAGDLLENHRGKPGLELWRQLRMYFDPTVEKRKLENTMEVMYPGKASHVNNLGLMIVNWENAYALC